MKERSRMKMVEKVKKSFFKWRPPSGLVEKPCCLAAQCFGDLAWSTDII